METMMYEVTNAVLGFLFWSGLAVFVGSVLFGWRGVGTTAAFFWAAIPAIISAIGSIYGAYKGRKSNPTKEMEALQAELLRRKLGIAKMISPGMIEGALNLGKGAVGALPLGFGTAAGSPQNAALQQMLQQFLGSATNKAAPYTGGGTAGGGCPADQYWNPNTQSCVPK